MKTIILTQGLYAVIDDDDYDNISKYKWNAIRTRNTIYAKSTSGIYMHRMILSAKRGVVIDHINKDSLDNRKANLRVCTLNENFMNSKKRSDSRLPYKGIQYFPSRGKQWRTKIRINGNSYYGKYRETAEAAALDYNVLAEKYHGEYATYNNIMEAKQ